MLSLSHTSGQNWLQWLAREPAACSRFMLATVTTRMHAARCSNLTAHQLSSRIYEPDTSTPQPEIVNACWPTASSLAPLFSDVPQQHPLSVIPTSGCVATRASKAAGQIPGRRFQGALLCLEVHVDHPKLLRVAHSPLPVGEQAPCKIAGHWHLSQLDTSATDGLFSLPSYGWVTIPAGQ